METLLAFVVLSTVSAPPSSLTGTVFEIAVDRQLIAVRNDEGRFGFQVRHAEVLIDGRLGLITGIGAGDRATVFHEPKVAGQRWPVATKILVKTIQRLRGRVVSVADGDTVTVLDRKNERHRVRLEGIDAPESGQAFGARASLVLNRKVFGQTVEVRWDEKDAYGRLLGTVVRDGRNINKEMVTDGCAWHFKKYSSDSELAEAELQARSRKTGLWSDADPVAPWDFRDGKGSVSATTRVSKPSPKITRRRIHRRTIKPPKSETVPEPSPPPKEEPSITVYVTKTGSKYHRKSCRYLRKSCYAIDLEDAKASYSPCSVCQPP